MDRVVMLTVSCHHIRHILQNPEVSFDVLRKLSLDPVVSEISQSTMNVLTSCYLTHGQNLTCLLILRYFYGFLTSQD
jgi:hypothetical protein